MRIILAAIGGILLVSCLFEAIAKHDTTAAQTLGVLGAIVLVGALVLGPDKRKTNR